MSSGENRCLSFVILSERSESKDLNRSKDSSTAVLRTSAHNDIKEPVPTGTGSNLYFAYSNPMM